MEASSLRGMLQNSSLESAPKCRQEQHQLVRNQGYFYLDPTTHGQSYGESYYSYFQKYAPQQDSQFHTYQPPHQHAYPQQLFYDSASQRLQTPELALGISVSSAAAAGGKIVDSGGVVTQRQQFGKVYDQAHPMLNPAAAAAVSALSQLSQFAGTMDAAERAMSGMHPKNQPFGPVFGHGSFPPEVHHRHPSSGNRRLSNFSKSSFWGKGRGRGMFKPRHTSEAQGGGALSSSSAASGDQTAQNSKQIQQRAWCELCKVDCNSLEILEHHRNGKRHKRNIGIANSQEQASDSKPEEHKESTEKKPKDQAEESVDLQAGRPRAGFGSNRGRGMKRKMKGGRGRKCAKTLDAQRFPGQPRQQKVVIPLICDLCNVKCDTENVFERHVSGKKTQLQEETV